MRIVCPLCGERDRREFTIRGELAQRPEDEGAWSAEWDAFVHLRDNPAGRTRELWHHGAGCGAWLVVARDTVSHEVFGAVLAGEVEA